ncbi:unnamed protein product [Parajaminaea phylloscopi]
MSQDSWDSKAISVSRGRGFGPWYSVMRWIGRRCSEHFFSSVEVIGGESVPASGPFILVCTHFSTIMDVAIISAHLPHSRPIHYWAKKGLYRGRLFAWILNDSGNIQVDRQNKDNQALFKGTFDAMEAGEAIALFPEGGSYTEPRLHAIKAGAAWAALEYAKFLAVDEEGQLKSHNVRDIKTGVKIVPASINYTEKSRFRSKAVFHIGQAFSVDEYSDEFLSASLASSGDSSLGLGPSDQSIFPYSAPQTPLPQTPAAYSDNETSYLSTASASTAASSAVDIASVKSTLNAIGSATHGMTRRGDRGAKGAVQKLTDRIGSELNAITINAPDWKTWHAMKVARELLWSGKSKGGQEMDIRQIVPISNALITLFLDDDRNLPLKRAIIAQEALVRLQMLQLASRTDLTTLNAVAPSVSGTNYAIPSLTRIVANLVANIVLLALKAPLYLPVFLFHSPAYFAGWYMSSKYARHEEESLASVKSLTAFPVAFLLYMTLFVVISALFLFSPPGLVVAFAIALAVRRLEERIVLDDGYRHCKLIAAYGRLIVVQGGRSVVSLNGNEPELEVMRRAVEDAQPVQYTLTKAFAARKASSRKSSSSVPSGVTAADIIEADSVPGPPRSPVTGKRLRRPAPIRLLKLALEARREAIVCLMDLIKAVKDEGSPQQREAWNFLEQNGARLG